MAELDASIYKTEPLKSPLAAAQEAGNLANTIGQNQLLKTQIDMSKLKLGQEQLSSVVNIMKGVMAQPPEKRGEAYRRGLALVTGLYPDLITKEKAAMLAGELPDDPLAQDSWLGEKLAEIQSTTEMLGTLYQQMTVDQGSQKLVGPYNQITGQYGATPGSGTTVPMGLPPETVRELGTAPYVEAVPGAPRPGFGPPPPQGAPLPGFEGPGGPQLPPGPQNAPVASPVAPAPVAQGPQPPPGYDPNPPAGMVLGGGMEAMRTQNIPLLTNLQTAASGAVANIGRMSNMKAALAKGEGFSAGPLAGEIKNMIASYNQVIDQMGLPADLKTQVDSVARQEEFTKLFNDLANGQAAISGTTDQQQRTLMGANPSAELSSMGADMLLDVLMGNEDMITLKNNLVRSLGVDRQPERLPEFEKSFNATIDPRAFQYRRMDAETRKKFRDTLSDGDAEKLQEAIKRMKGLRWL